MLVGRRSSRTASGPMLQILLVSQDGNWRRLRLSFLDISRSLYDMRRRSLQATTSGFKLVLGT